MHKYTLLLLLFSFTLFAQPNTNEIPFKPGEWLRFKLHYGVITAGFATLEVKDDSVNNRYVIEGKGWTIGMFKWFFKVDDHYKTHIDDSSLIPNYFERNVYEGGYEINRKINFDRQANLATISDKKNDKRADSLYAITPLTGDMISSFYYARQFSADTLKIDDNLYFDVFMDFEIFKFSLKFLGRETIDTSFGKIKCLKFTPLVQSGRVFKEDEGVVLWITDDKNKIPIRIKSDLRVGAILVDLEAYKGLKYPFEVFVDN